MRVSDSLNVCVTVLLLARFCTAESAVVNSSESDSAVDPHHQQTEDHFFGPQTFSVTTIKEDPYTVTKGSDLEGFCIDLLTAVASRVGFKYNLHLVKDGKYGSRVDGQNWNGMIGEVMRGEADLAVAPLTITAMRAQVVDMTTPFMQTGISFIQHIDAEVNDLGFFHFLCPFSMETWVGILAVYLVTAICMCISARLSPREWAQPQTEDNSFTILHSLWYTAAALTLQGAGPHPKALSGRVISVIWWLFTVVVLASYFANLVCMLHTDTKHTTIKDFEDLANQDVIDYGAVANGSTYSYFKFSNNPVHERIHQHMEQRKSYVQSMEEGLRRVQEGNFIFIGESVSLDLATVRYCNLERSREEVALRGYGFAVPLGSLLKRPLNQVITLLTDSGRLDLLRRMWWKSGCREEGGQDSPLPPHSLKGVFLLLALGLGLGLLVALLELASQSQSSAKEQKKSCCTVLSKELGQRLGSRSEEKTADTPDKSKA